MRAATDVVRKIRQTEKGTRIASMDQFVLDVAPDANKIEIQHAVETLFNVKVTKVNTQNCHGKWRRLRFRWGRRPDWKKAVVTLAKGQKIEVKG
jgi:large subunit ribosomal protein L23